MAMAFMRQIFRMPRSHTELVRYWVIASLSISCILIAAIALLNNPLSIYQQLFFIPIIYAAYYYPKYGIVLAGLLGIAYQALAYFVLFPELNTLIFVTTQVIVFILVATLIAFFSSRIRHDEMEYRQVFENARLGIVQLRNDHRTLLDANPFLSKLLEYTPAEIRSVPFRDLFFADSDCHVFLNELKKNGQLDEYETRFVTKSGQPLWVLLTCTISPDEIITCTVLDINDRKETEALLTEAEISQNTTLDAMSDAIHVVDKDYRIIHANKSLLRLCDQYLKNQDPLGKTPWEICRDPNGQVEAGYREVMRTGTILVTTETTRIGDSDLDTETRKIPVFEHGQVYRIVTVVRDVSEKRVAEKALRESEYKYRQLADNSPISIIIAHHGTIHYVNPTFSRLTGYQNEELLGRKFSDLVHTDDRNEARDLMAKWESGRFVTTQRPVKFIRKNGDTRRAEIFVSSIQDRGEQAEMINLVDVTQQILLEEKLRADLERRRDIITTVAHELRTPLQPIMGYLNLLIQDPEGFCLNDETQKIIALCLKNVDRERQIVNQMLELTILDSGRIRLKYSEFSIANLVSSVIEAGGYQLQGELISVIPAEVLVKADMDRLYVVIDSIISNAVKYSKPPRRITFRYAAGEQCHHVCISDNGIGIDDLSLNLIFEPFHLADAAKLSRKYDRIGLSLSIAKKYIELHGGTISVTSKVGEGSTFTIELPREPDYES